MRLIPANAMATALAPFATSEVCQSFLQEIEHQCREVAKLSATLPAALATCDAR